MKRLEHLDEIISTTGEMKILELIEVLRPKPSPRVLTRVGGNKDGAYLLPNDLQGIKACFSPGLSNRKDFEDELLEQYGIPSHMCDFSSDVEKFKTPLGIGQTFKKKWLDVDGRQDSISLADWVNELEPEVNDDLLLQMDIEGAEYRNLLNTPEAILRRFRIIVIELHRLNVVNRPDEFQKELGPLLILLDQHFLCVHAHPNNCCGDVTLTESKLNVPRVHELTFLRRDRFDSFSQSNCYPPLLPHPLDVSMNVVNKPPLFLNEYWLESRQRAPESKIKMLGDQVRYLTQALKHAKASPASPDSPDVLSDLHSLCQHAVSTAPAIYPKPAETELVDVAEGKVFTLSTTHAACPDGRIVMEKCPFFFHTGGGRHQFITIDLGSECSLFELHIKNRSNACKERARCLFYCAHNETKPDLGKGLPVTVDKAFLKAADHVSVTNLRGYQARYLTIFSPENTWLHFSAVKVYGKVLP